MRLTVRKDDDCGEYDELDVEIDALNGISLVRLQVVPDATTVAVGRSVQLICTRNSLSLKVDGRVLYSGAIA
jgi:hypothetical protein